MKLLWLVALFAMAASAHATAAPLDISTWANRSVMVVTAHPDDAEAMVGGLMPDLVAMGCKVVYVIVTSGDKGCSNPTFNCASLSGPAIAQIRQKEAQHAAAISGVHEVVFLGYGDGEVGDAPQKEIRSLLVGLVRQHRPDIVFSWHIAPQLSLQPGDGWDDLGYHPDHQAVGTIAAATIVGPAAGDARFFPEISFPAWSVSQFYLFDCLDFTHYRDIGANMDNKIAAFSAHSSQFVSPTIVAPLLNELGARLAQSAGAPPSVKFAETYQRVCLSTGCALPPLTK